MEQLIIFLLFVVASIVSSIIQKKKKTEEEAATRRELPQRPGASPRPGPPAGPARPAVARWPRTALEWQEQLRKMVEENAPPMIKPVIVAEKRTTAPPPMRPAPAPLVRPVEIAEGDVVFKSPLHESTSAYTRAANLQAKVEERLRAVDQRTATHRPAMPHRAAAHPASQVLRKLRRRPAALREAFIASLIFSTPKSLENGSEKHL
jgi:hypothetical protein